MSWPAPASRLRGIAPFRVMAILARAQALAAAGRDIVHMEVGEPDFPAPPEVNAAARAALAAGQTHYTPALGLPALREAIAGWYAERFGVTVDPARVIVTPGASGALQLVLGVLLDSGDRVGIQDPGYPCNRHMIALYDGEAVAVDPADAATTPGLSGLMLATPANPTGEVLDPQALAAIHHALSRAGRFLIVDEIYQGLQYESRPHTALALGGEHLFVINSFSKFFGMTGYRVGWAVVPEAWVEPIDRLAQNLFLAPPTVAQHAALAAFSPPVLEELDRRRDRFRERRDRLHAGLRELGFGLPERPPGGAFYLYARLPQGIAEDGEAFAARLLEEAGVAITPGSDFGVRETARHVRFAYTTELARIEQGLERLSAFLG